MSDVLLVLGMHRSGTSSVAGVFSKLGAGTPKSEMAANSANPRGFYESRALMRVNDNLLASAGSFWSDWLPFNSSWMLSPAAATFRQKAKETYLDEFGEAPLTVMKDPRICKFAPFWLGVFCDLKITPHIVIPIRAPLNSAKSLTQVQGTSLNHGLLLWLRHVLDSEYDTRGCARSLFTWKEFLADWQIVCDKISLDTKILWPQKFDNSSVEIERFLSREFVHYDTEDHEFFLPKDVTAWLSRTYAALLELTMHPESNAAMANLNEVRLAFNEASESFHRFIIKQERSSKLVPGGLSIGGLDRDALMGLQQEFVSEKAKALTQLAVNADASEGDLVISTEAMRDDDIFALREREESQAATPTEWAQAVAAVEPDLQSRSGSPQISNAAMLRRLAAEQVRDEAAERGREEIATQFQASSAEHEALYRANAALLETLAVEQARAEVAERNREDVAAQLLASSIERETLERANAGLLEMLASEQTRAEVAERAREEAAAQLLVSSAQLEALRRANAALQETLVAEQARAGTAERSREELAAQLLASSADRKALERSNSTLRESLAAEWSRAEAAERARDEFAAHLQDSLIERDALDRMNTKLQTEAQSERARFHRDLQQAISDAEERDAEQMRRSSALQRSQEIALKSLRDDLVDTEAELAAFRRVAQEATTFMRMRSGRADVRLAKRLMASALFDVSYYRAHYREATSAGCKPSGEGLAVALHYVKHGFCHGYRPNEFFDSRYYLDQNEDVRHAGINPLLHYFLHGWKEGRDPSLDFQTTYYLECNPDVRHAKVNPLVHYLKIGRSEGRRASALSNCLKNCPA